METSVIKNEWLADLLTGRRDLITEYWIDEIRNERIPGYESITDEQLRADLPPTVDSMIDAFRTGDTEGPRQHSLGVIRRRLASGMRLPDLQMSLHALQRAVMRIVRSADIGVEKEFEALLSASTLYYLVALIAAAVYEQLRSEEQRRFRITYELGKALSRNLDLAATLDTAVGRMTEYTEAESVAILLAKPEIGRDEVRAYHNLHADVIGVLPDVSESLGCNSVDSGEVDVRDAFCMVSDIRSHSDLEAWSDLLTSHNYTSLICMLLVAKQRRVGTLFIAWSQARYTLNTETDVIIAMAGHIANAIQNATLYEEAKGRRELGVLLEASKVFTSTLDMQGILNSFARIGAEAAKADVAVVYTRDTSSSKAHTAHHVRDRRAMSVFPRIMEAVISEGEEDAFRSLGYEFASGKPSLYPKCSQFPGQMRSLSGIGASGMIIPLRQKDELFGALTLISMAPNAFSEEDLALATGIAELASLAIENARSYEYERNISATLQRIFLPASLPVIEGYETAAFYRPAMAEAEIGGDFYDAFVTSDSKINIIIGDVSGKGLKAAIPTAMGKYIVRAYAAKNLPPSIVMARFNRAFLENATEEMLMTAFYGVLDPNTDVFTYACAGHNPPLLYTAASDQVSEIPICGTCLGIVNDVEYENMQIRFEPGDALLMFTDGAIDVKADNGRLNAEGLSQLFKSSVHGSADQIVQDVSGGIWKFGHGKLPDDVAIVVLKRQEISEHRDY